MKIIHMHIHLASGGIESMIIGLANEMVKTNDVTVGSIYEITGDTANVKKLAPGIKLVSADKKKKGVDLISLWRVYKLLRKGNYDIINIHGFLYYYIIAILLLRRRSKFFYTIHSDAYKENKSWDGKILPIKRFLFKKGWVWPITISKESKRSFTALYGIDSKMIYNGVVSPDVKPFDTSRFRKTADTRILFHPGRLSEPKNQRMLCETCARLIDRGYDIVLLIAGADAHDGFLDKISPFFSDRIIYLGERDDVIDILAASDAFCLSSIWEGLPVTLLEALSVGCIPICTPVGGIPEVITDGENGFLSSSNSGKDYYAAMKRYLDSDDTVLMRMKRSAKERFNSFNIRNTSEEYLNFYTEVLNQNR